LVNIQVRPHDFMASRVALTIFQGRTGDRNSRAMAGSALLGELLSRRVDSSATHIGRPDPPLQETWYRELEAARPGLLNLADTIDRLLTAHRIPLTVLGRSAAALATLPVVARHWPEACVVWFDAHADSNTPTSFAAPYLGGMVISGAAGMWDSGLGAGLRLSNVVLVGSRDFDPDEERLIEAGILRLVQVGTDLPRKLRAAIGSRAIYVHFDCDVLEPGIVPTEYVSPGGLSLENVRTACEMLAQCEVVGLEIAEYEATWPDSQAIASPEELLNSLSPLFGAMCRD
jgi:arginase